MSRSYQRFVAEIETGTGVLIREAWAADIRDIRGGATYSDDQDPQFQSAIGSFTRDIRGYLSWQPWRRLAVV